MSKVLPEAQNWNHYWSLDQTQRFTKLSWSKRRILSVLEPYVKKSQSALDAGCGSGFFSEYFCNRGLKTVSLDYSKEALEIAQAKTSGRSQSVQANLCRDNISQMLGQKFDLIFTDGLLEHFVLEDQDKIFRNLINVLSPSGVLVTFVPNRWSPWELIRPFYMPGIEEKPFVLKELIQLQERQHLNIIAQGGVNTFPFAFSPDKLFGSTFGMLLYTAAQKT